MEKIKVAIVGTQGVPAQYGGFETLTENLLGMKIAVNIEYTVFCSSKDMPSKMDTYKGANLKYVGLHANGAQSIPYDIVSMLKCLSGYHTILILGVSGCIFMPFLRLLTKSRIVVNIDGLEHRRDKWNKLAKWILRTSEKLAVKFADDVIADNQGIQEYVQETYSKNAHVIAYGGDHVKQDISETEQEKLVEEFGVKKNEYALSICRIEPENNVDMILSSFAKTGNTLVMVGNFHNSVYSRNLKEVYKKYDNIHLIDACYDLRKLYALRNNAQFYVHGHSAGGTNPSLVEAMFFGRPIVAFGVNYNRYSTNNEAEYFNNADELQAMLVQPRKQTGDALRAYAENNYTWRRISSQYEELVCK